MLMEASSSSACSRLPPSRSSRGASHSSRSLAGVLGWAARKRANASSKSSTTNGSSSAWQAAQMNPPSSLKSRRERWVDQVGSAWGIT